MVTTPLIWSNLVKFLKLLYVTHNRKITMLDLQLQLHPWVRKVWKKPTIIILTRQPFILVSFSIVSYKQEMRKSIVQRNRKWKKQ